MMCLYWFVFSLFVALLPIVLALITSPVAGSVWRKLPPIIANGELFLIAVGLAAPAVTNCLSRDTALKKLRGTIIAASFVTSVCSIALFADINTHSQEQKDRRVASEQYVTTTLQKALQTCKADWPDPG